MPNADVDVAAGAPNAASYTDNGDMTVTDDVTGLMWQKAAAPGTYAQAMAVAYCPTLTVGGHRDWRLPTIIELVSLVDVGSSDASINEVFPSTSPNIFWSSSPVPLTTYGWIVSNGSTISNGSALKYSVRCVR